MIILISIKAKDILEFIVWMKEKKIESKKISKELSDEYIKQFSIPNKEEEDFLKKQALEPLEQIFLD